MISLNLNRQFKQSMTLSTKLLIAYLVLITSCFTVTLVKTADSGESPSSPLVDQFTLFEGDGFAIDERLAESIEEERHSREELFHHGLSSSADKSSSSSSSQDQHGKTESQSVCPHSFFACANGECLSPKWRCDGHYDCDDFSDELNCTNVDLSVTPGALGDPKTRPKAPPSSPALLQHHDHANEITFNSSQEPLMIFSTGLAIRGYWMRTRIYFDIVSSGLPPARPEMPSITQALSIFFEVLNFERQPSNPAKSEAATTRSRSTIVGVDMDPHNKEVFWVELGKDAGVYSTLADEEQFEARSRRTLSGSRRKTVVDSGLLSPEDIALDLLGKNIYITDAGLPAIVVCSIKHSHCKIIAKDGLHKPRAIIADSTTGWLTYTDWGDYPGIYLVSMDGQRRETLIDTDIVWPNGIAVDHLTNQLYWADARLSKIERIDLSTKKRHEVIKETAANPFSLALFENRVYWSDWSGSDIRTCDKMSGNGTKVVMRTDNIYGIHIYHPNMELSPDSQVNPCWSKRCSHLCLLAPRQSRFADRKTGSLVANCACPNSMALSAADKSSCFEVGLSFLLINVKNYIAQLFPERIGLETVEKIIYSSEHTIHDVASDWQNYRLFFFDGLKQHIYTVDMSESVPKIEQFAPTSQSVRGLLYDSPSDNLYWLDSEKGHLSMRSIVGKFETVVRKNLDRPTSMVLDSKNRVFYIALLGKSPRIIRTDIFAEVESDLVIIGSDIGQPVALHLDEQQQRLYWADSRRESIESLDLDIKSQQTGIKQNSRIYHRRKLGAILAFAVYHDHFVWTLKNGDYLYKAKMEEHVAGSTAPKISEFPKPVSLRLPPNPSNKDPSTNNERIVMVDPPREIIKSPCQTRACSLGCVLDSVWNAICICPDNYKIQPSNRTNCIPISSSHEPCEPGYLATGDRGRCRPAAGQEPQPASLIAGELVTLNAAAPTMVAHADGEILLGDPGKANRMTWLIVLLVLLSVTGLITVASLLILYKQGRLPRQASPLSVSFFSQSHDKDGAMLLLDNDT